MKEIEMKTPNVHLVMRSSNAKTGQIPVSTSSKETCPSACPLKGNGCYAESGPLALHWNNVTAGKSRVMNWSQFLNAIRALPYGQLWRHNQAGDLPGENNLIDARALMQLVQANLGRNGFTYTHYPMTHGNNRAAVRDANMHGFTINLSADDLDEADELASLGIAPVVVVVPHDMPNKFETLQGRRGIVCPAQTRDGVTCATCKLCARVARPTIIGFRAHGSRAKTAEKVFFMKKEQ